MLLAEDVDNGGFVEKSSTGQELLNLKKKGVKLNHHEEPSHLKPNGYRVFRLPSHALYSIIESI